VTTTAPTATAQHTYAAAGTYTVTLIATDTGGNASTAATANVTVVPENPPTARLSVTQLGNPAFTVAADASASTDADMTPIASYRFTFGDGTAAVTTTVPTATAQHTYAGSGNFTVTVTATDSAGLVSAPATATVAVLGKISTDRMIAASGDDAEQRQNGSVNLTSSSLQLVIDGSNQQVVGLRWPNITIARGTAISAAYIQFTAKATESGATSLTINGQADDNAATFTTTSNSISTRPRTTASVAWSPNAWTSGQAGTDQRTPDLSAVIQEIVNRSGWASGNAIALVVTGTGTRTAYTFDGSSTQAAVLHLEYLGVATAPTARLTVTPAGLTATADGSASTPGDAPIASYRFDFGDGTTPVTTNAPTATAQHTYAAAGTYTVSLVVTDLNGRSSSPATSSVTVSAPSGGGSIAVYVGYYDTHHADGLRAKPNPWYGSSGIQFVAHPTGGRGAGIRVASGSTTSPRDRSRSRSRSTWARATSVCGARGRSRPAGRSSSPRPATRTSTAPTPTPPAAMAAIPSCARRRSSPRSRWCMSRWAAPPPTTTTPARSRTRTAWTWPAAPTPARATTSRRPGRRSTRRRPWP